MWKSSIWGAIGSQRRSLQALALALVALVAVLLSTLGGSGGAPVLAQQGPPPLRAHYGHKIVLPGSLPSALRSAKRTGAAKAGQQLQLTVALQLSDPNGLAALIANQQNPKSSEYHKYITPAEFTARYAPTAQSVAAVRQFLSSAGLKVTSVSQNRTLVHATGTVAQAQKAFGVTIATYTLNKHSVYAPTTPLQIPDTFSTIVQSVVGLDNTFKASPQLLQPTTTSSGSSGARPTSAQFTSPFPGAYGPADLRGAYDVNNVISAGGDGTNQRVAVFELAPYIPADISAYRSEYGLPSATINNLSVDGGVVTCTPGASCDNGSGITEADLDMEVVSALAPNATQDVWVGPNSETGLLDTYADIVYYDVDEVTTTSWGICESLAGSSVLNALDNIFAQGAAQGQTFLAASGDTGTDACYRSDGDVVGALGVLSPADDPYVLGVGGTSLTLSGGSYSAETVWNSGFASAGGGGLSSDFSQPAWQLGGGVTNAYSTGEREVPDITADADPTPGYSVYCSSDAECGSPSSPWGYVGGTSAATPLWAGILTDINAYLTANLHSSLGWVNPTLYTLFSNAQTYTPYHDITVGNNDSDYPTGPNAGLYPATACYDLASGMGSPDAWNIARDVFGGLQTSGGGPCPGVPPATQLVQDGGFEAATNSPPWTQYSSGPYNEIYASASAHTGNAAYFPCGYVDCDDRVSQTITIPPAANFSKATLSFWLDTESLSPFVYSTLPCTDHFYVTFSTPDGTVVPGGSVMASCPSQNVFAYEFESSDVTSVLKAYAGQQLTLTFRGTTANEAPLDRFYTGWSLDDISLTVS